MWPRLYCSIMYTSGTTGDPKGVLLTHRNVMAMMAAVNQRVAKSVATPEDAYLSYLPLAHIFERAIMQCAFSRGTRVGFYQVLLTIELHHRTRN